MNMVPSQKDRRTNTAEWRKAPLTYDITDFSLRKKYIHLEKYLMLLKSWRRNLKYLKQKKKHTALLSTKTNKDLPCNLSFHGSRKNHASCHGSKAIEPFYPLQRLWAPATSREKVQEVLLTVTANQQLSTGRDSCLVLELYLVSFLRLVRSWALEKILLLSL